MVSGSLKSQMLQNFKREKRNRIVNFLNGTIFKESHGYFRQGWLWPDQYQQIMRVKNCTLLQNLTNAIFNTRCPDIPRWPASSNNDQYIETRQAVLALPADKRDFVQSMGLVKLVMCQCIILKRLAGLSVRFHPVGRTALNYCCAVSPVAPARSSWSAGRM